MPIDVKTLRSGDEAILTRVDEDVFDDPLDTRATHEFLDDPRHHLAVAIDDGVVVGFASAVLYVHPDKPRPELWINEVGVASSHQRRGIARKLLDSLLGIAREANCSAAWVLTDRSNEAATRLYASAGGEEARGDLVMYEFGLDGAGSQRGNSTSGSPPG